MIASYDFNPHAADAASDANVVPQLLLAVAAW